MNEKNIICEQIPLSSRTERNKSIPLLIQKKNKGKGIKINKSIKKLLPNADFFQVHNNKPITSRKNSGIIDYERIKFLDDKKFHDDLYINMNLNSAPSFSDNVYKIHKLINEEKNRKFNNIYNILSNSPFTAQSNNDINDIAINQLLLQSSDRNKQIKIIKRNNSCQDVFNSKVKFKQLIKKNENPILINYTKAITRNSPKICNDKIQNFYSIKSNRSNLSSSTTNKSKFTIRFPEQKSNSKSNKIEEPTTTLNSKIILPKLKNVSSQNSSISNRSESGKVSLDIQKNEPSFITSLSVDKMKYNINQLLIDKSKKRTKFGEYEEKILKLKLCQIYQKEKLEMIMNDDKYNIQEKIDYIIKMYKNYEKIFIDYMDNIKRYNNFLYHAFYENEMQLRLLHKEKNNINYDMEIIVDKMINKQIQLEYLINLRNFLFYMKNRDKKIIKMNNAYVYKISNRNNFINKLFDIFGRYEDSLAYKYLKRIIPVGQLEKIIKPKIHITKGTIRKVSSIKHSPSIVENQNEDLLSPPPAGEKIFQSIEEFLDIMNYLTDNDIELLEDYEKREISKKELAKELDDEIEFNKKLENDEKNIYIKKCIKLLEKEKEKYFALTKKYEHYYDLYTKKKELSSLQLNYKVFSYKAFNNLDFYRKIKYNKLRVKYKIEGLVLIEKLIYNVKKILELNEELKVFPMKDIYHYIPEGILIQILNIKLDYFNQENQFLINDYTLQLIKLLEFFAEFIKNKNVQLKLKDNYKYSKARELVLNERKMFNSKFKKKMLINDRENNLKELKERWNKKIIREPKKYDICIKHYLNKSLEIKNYKHDLCCDEKDANEFLNFEEN